MSTAIAYKYLKHINPKCDIEIIFHRDKAHGLDGVYIDSEIDFLWIPDAGTNDTAKLKELVKRGVEVLVTDHHKLEEHFEYVDGVVFVNNQLSPDYPNKDLCGCGVTWKVLQALDNRLGDTYSNTLKDYVGVANIGDNMANHVETRYFMNYCCDINNITSTFLKRVIDEKILKYNTLNGKSIAWNVVPLVNSICRYGTMEDKAKLFEATVSDDIGFIDETIKLMVSVKGKQDRGRKNGTEKIVEYIEKNELYKYPVMIVDATAMYKDTTISGLLANNISEMYNRPVLIIGGKDDLIKGSARNNNETMCSDFRQWCLDTGLFELSAGHPNAFGIVVKKENVQAILDKSLEDFEMPSMDGKEFIVDFEIDFKDLKKKDIIALGKLKDIYVTDIREPKILVKNIYTSSKSIEKLGSRGNVMKIFVDGISMIKQFLSRDFYDTLTKKNEVKFGSADLKIDAICNMAVNEYNGKSYPQLDIITAESEINNRAKKTIDDIF